MEITSNDILNLANAYVAIQQNTNLGNGYVLSSSYRNDILYDLELATRLYRNQLEKSLKED